MIVTKKLDQSETIIYLCTATLLFLLSPLLSLPLIVVGIRKGYSSAYILFCLFLGILAYIIPPYYDLYRHAETFQRYESFNGSLGEIYALEFSLNGLIIFPYYFFSKNGFPFEIIRLITTSVSFFLLVTIFRYKITHSNKIYSLRQVFIRFLILFFFFDLIYTIGGVRYGLALTIYLYAIHKLIDKRHLQLFILFAILASLLHVSFSFFCIVTIILYNLHIKLKTGLISIFVGFLLLGVMLPLFGSLFGMRFDWYFTDKASPTLYSMMSPVGLLLFVLPKMMAIPFAILLIKNYKPSMKWGRIALAWFIISNVFIENAVVFYRSWWVFTAVGVFYLLELESLKNISNKIINILLLAGIMFSCLNIVNMRSFVLDSDFPKLLLPVPYILKDSYSSNWIYTHVDSDGSPKNKK